MEAENYAPFMRQAMTLAEKGRWTACPNPTVGAVLVQDGKVCASGWHHQAGEPHAEIMCLQDAERNGINPAQCTMVVTLEPCSHYGRTPPCTEAILAAGIRTVVYGLADPTPRARGGAALLAAGGVTVVGPILERECRDLVADFLIWQRDERPYVLLKLAATLDGRIATRTGQSRWISSEESRKHVHELRAGVAKAGGAVLVGGKTFRADNPSLTARAGAYSAPQPLACILSSELPEANANFKLLTERAQDTVFFSSTDAAVSERAMALRALGCRIFSLPERGSSLGLDLSEMLHTLRKELKVPYVLCEGGGQLGLSLLEAGLVDEFHLHLAPTILGDNEAPPLFDGRSPLLLNEAIAMRICEHQMCGGDVHLKLRPGTD